MKLNLVSLGCARNLVDSEVMLGRLLKEGWDISEAPDDADIIIVNTCSFISSAIDESIDTILELAKFKEIGRCKHLVVTGCLPERYREKLAESLPEVDIFLGTGAYDQIVHVIKECFNTDSRPCLLPLPASASLQHAEITRVLTSSHMAFLKVAEGCSKHCTYCIIPRLRGRQRSRPLEDIIKEGGSLIGSGIKELVLVAQDTTAYGSDLSSDISLDQLLLRLSDIDETVWIRLLYGHPESIDKKVMAAIADRDNICSYLDIPIQHASNRILKKMGRSYTRDHLRNLFDTTRTLIPDVALRTTVIVGFPGETEDEFEDLLDFIEEIRFDHLGVFTYSDSDDLPSHRLPSHVNEKAASLRHDRLMTCQADISLKNNQKRIGQICLAIVDEGPENSHFIGRVQSQAPEVDGITYVEAKNLEHGELIKIKITDAFEYDLVGEPV